MASVGIDDDKTDEGQIKKHDLKIFDKSNIKYYKLTSIHHIISCVHLLAIEFVAVD